MTYAELKDTLVRWLNREGMASIVDEADTFLLFTENKIARDLDLRVMEESTTIQASAPTLPSDLMRVKSLTLREGSNSGTVDPATHQQVIAAGVSGVPSLYTVIGDEFVFGPSPQEDFTLTLVYWKQLPILSDSNTSNWLSLNVPELLLFGSLVEACTFMKDDVRAQLWAGRYEEVKKSLETTEERLGREPGGLQTRTNQVILRG